MYLALLACTMQLAGPLQAPSAPTRDLILDRIGHVLQYAAFVPGVDFSHWDQISTQYRTALDSARTAEDFALRTTTALGQYGVSHLFLAPPGEALGDSVEGFGFDTTELDGHKVVTRVFSDTEAEKDGLKPGTVLETEILSDTQIVLSFFDSTQQLRAVTIHKAKVIPKLQPRLVEFDKLGAALEVGDFTFGFDRTLIEDLISKASKYSNLVIDLRGNSGGYPKNGIQLLDYLLPAGTRVGATISKESLDQFWQPIRSKDAGHILEARASVVGHIKEPEALVTAKVDNPYKGHIVVLIDNKTRSLGEVTAQALRDFAGAEIFGRPSAGEVLEMVPADLPDGYTIYYPHRDYWTAKGERIEGNPIVPDFPVQPGTEEAGPLRAPLQIKALRWLSVQYPNGEK